VSESDRNQLSTKWYDGFFYDKFITPLQKKIMEQIDILVTNNSTVLDVGCGPGALAIRLSAKCRRVIGLDRSEKMITYAKGRLAKKNIKNVDFVCDDAAEMRLIHNEQFAFAVVCVCLHGMSCSIRQKVIANCCRFAEKLVLVDYVAPFPANITGKVQNIIEALEGRDSYANFLDWERSGGIDDFVKNLGLPVEEEIPWGDGFGKTILLTSRGTTNR